MSYTTHLHRAGTTQSRLSFLTLLPVYPLHVCVGQSQVFLDYCWFDKITNRLGKIEVLTHTTVITMPIILLSPFLLTKSIEITMFV